MCGIVGYWNKQGASASVVEKMALKIQHRGPDGAGVWLNTDGELALAHRRLAILDLSPAGHQPMMSPCERFTLVFNGEIYNHLDLRADLEQEGGHFDWRGHSDTETLLAALRHWGIEQTLQKLNGMFAFALWDRQKKVLTLARDRLGEKPLYYGWQKNSFLFASELKALRVHPDWVGEINRNALTLYMRHNYIPSPYSIYKGISKLTPGTFLQLSYSQLQTLQIPEPVPYWQAKEVAEYGVNNPWQLSDDEAVAKLDDLLRQTIQEKMISDVPLGAFLSGGIDSSAVVAIMQQQSAQQVKTFSIGFHEQGYNEAEHAKAVARHLGTDHTEMYVTSRQAMDVIPRLPDLYDEPFSDSSQIPTFLVSEMTRQHVTVALSGDGGDELFAGYNRYFLGQSLWNKLSVVPKGMRSFVASALTLVSPQRWDKLAGALGGMVPALQGRTGDKLHKLADILAVESPEAMYRQLVSHWQNPESVVIGGHESPTVLTDRTYWAKLDDFTQRMQYLDAVSYLPDDILVKVDRAAMGVSLETRVPFLDHRLFEFAWHIPMHQKIRQGQGKWILRQLLYQYVPQKMIDRPKMGFGIPIDSWLRGPLREWAEDLLDKKNMQEQGFFEVNEIHQKWSEHLSGKRNWQYLLWDVLMFQAWLNER